MEEIAQPAVQDEVRTEKTEPSSSDNKKKFSFPSLRFWKRSSHSDVEWNDLDFGVFWVVSLLLFFAKIGLWLPVAWVVVWFVVKSWKGK
jgi:hypothetical protein